MMISVEDKTWTRGDMKFLFECLTRDFKVNTRKETSYFKALFIK